MISPPFCMYIRSVGTVPILVQKHAYVPLPVRYTNSYFSHTPGLPYFCPFYFRLLIFLPAFYSLSLIFSLHFSFFLPLFPHFSKRLFYQMKSANPTPSPPHKKARGSTFEYNSPLLSLFYHVFIFPGIVQFIIHFFFRRMICHDSCFFLNMSP